MIANVKCLKCGETGKFDVGSDVKTVEEAQAKIDAAHVQNCPFGKHVELSDIGYEVVSLEEGEAPTDEAVIAEMESKGHLCWDSTANTPAGIEVVSFAFGCPIAECPKGKKDFWMDFMSLPSGKRLWYCRKDDYEQRMGVGLEAAEA